MINWETLTWEAFATLFTGILAVSGAVYVGQKQTEIQAKQLTLASGQLDIQRQLADLEKLKLRMEVFEHRRGVFEAVQAFLVYTTTNGRSPFERQMLTGKAQADALALCERMVQAMDESRFLFSDGVSNDLDYIAWLAAEFDGFNRSLKTAGVVSREREILARNSMGHMDKFNLILRDLSRVFGDDLFLGQRTGSTGMLEERFQRSGSPA